jgi:hypothetical protein
VNCDLLECIVEDTNRGNFKYRWEKGDFNYCIIKRTGDGRGNRTNHHGKLTDVKVVEMRQRAALGATFAQLGRDFGVSLNQARLIVKRERWKHVP